LVVPAAWAGLVAPAAWAELVALAASAVLEAGIVRPPCRLAEAASGNTIRNIAAAHRIATGRPQTDSGVRRAVTRWPSAKRVPGSSLAGRAAIWRATAGELA